MFLNLTAMITLLNNDYYFVIDNSDCNAPNDYMLVALGPSEPADGSLDEFELPF